jgi:diadenosine tetraphosphatase ApaH/serine/threonine PP2A family protein phosphatase
MRVLIISDIHANLAAFEAVLQDAAGQWDTIWCLGDLVGYGPDPNECVELLRQYDHISLSGNHDWAVLDKLDVNAFNQDARAVIHWTRATISAETYDYLADLPTTMVCERFTLAHASPRQPVWEYILDAETARANFDHFTTRCCLVGHTHIPIMFAEDNGSNKAIPHAPAYTQTIQLGETRFLFNPGSVGQPRDSDPRAAYALLNTDEMTWRFQRVDYPVDHTQERMRQRGIPARLIKRLEYGW